MFSPFLYALRGQGLVVGIEEWNTFLGALGRGLTHDLDGMYALGRSLLCRSEGHYDAYDLAFASAFRDLDIQDDLRQKLEEWLRQAADQPLSDVAPHEFKSLEEVLEALQQRLKEQQDRHDGGNRWIGTRGRSPFGHG